MTFASAMGEGTDAIYNAFGVAAVYTDRDAATTNVTVIVDRNLSQYGEVANVSAQDAVVCVRTSELAEAPRREDTFTVGAKVWTVDSLIASDEQEWRVLAS